jgi:hypothetical protein
LLIFFPKNVYVANVVPFENFMVNFVNTQSLSLTLTGSAVATVTTAIGQITLTLNGISVNSALKGTCLFDRLFSLKLGRKHH